MILLALLRGAPGAIPKSPVARWEWVFPVVETLHIFRLAMLVGAVTILDLCLMGVTLRRVPISQLAKGLSPWIWAGIVVQFITAPLGLRRPAAVVSLGLWFCVPLAGMWTGNL